MIAHAVESAAGHRLAFFRLKRQAREFLEANRDRPEPVFRAVRIVPVVMQEQLWAPDFRPLASPRLRVVSEEA